PAFLIWNGRLLLLYFDVGLAEAFDLAVADPAKRQGVFAALEFGGWDAQHERLARFRANGFEPSSTHHFLPVRRLQRHLIQRKTVFRQFQAQPHQIGSAWDEEMRRLAAGGISEGVEGERQKDGGGREAG